MRVEELEIDEANELEMLAHRVTAREARQVVEDTDRKFLRNANGHSATHIMVGRTRGGRLLSIPIAPTPTEGVWRPSTGFDSPADHIGRLKGIK